MPFAKRGFLLAAGLLSFVSLPSGSPRAERSRQPRVVAPRGVPGSAIYPAGVKEHYLTSDQLDYVRPGLDITVNSITIPADGKPLVDLTLADDFDQPLDRLGKVTPGPVSVSFVLSWWDPAARRYTAYTTRRVTSPITNVSTDQAAADSGGVWTAFEPGHYTYKFKTALPAGFDQTRTHTLGIYSTRDMTGILDKNFYANVEKDFRPDAAPVAEVWDKMENAACNTCHNPLAAHGGSRRDVKLCVLCHSPQTLDPDTGNTVDFKVMVHKIHRGEDLPSVKAGKPYQIIGFRQAVNDFSTVVFPQDIRNCQTCHAAPATQAPNWYTFPSRAACQACHDDVNFATGENHPGGVQVDDSACATCHQPQGSREWDASITGAHTVPYKSTQLKGLKAQILSVTNAGAGQKPTVTFQITQNDGTAVSPSSFGSNLNLLMGGPTADYAVNPFRERADAASFNGTIATYTFKNSIPQDATGTWNFSLEARRTVVLNPAPMDSPNVTEAAFNPVFYAAVTDGSPAPRRAVVDLGNCNKCHDRLALHGGQRFNTEECVMCHNPNGSDQARRPADKAPAESIDFKRMIHRIHTGENLAQDFTVYGFFIPPNPPNPVNFNHVRFPGDRRDCTTCHIDGTQQVPEDAALETRLPTITLRDWYTPMRPVAAACLGCHSEKHQAAHAFVMTAPFGESCAACHGADADFAVDKVHAR